jgi:hypothetical protein
MLSSLLFNDSCLGVERAYYSGTINTLHFPSGVDVHNEPSGTLLGTVNKQQNITGTINKKKECTNCTWAERGTFT